MDEYLIPTKDAEAEFVEKRSRFIGRIWHTETEEEALACIKKILNSSIFHSVPFINYKDNSFSTFNSISSNMFIPISSKMAPPAFPMTASPAAPPACPPCRCCSAKGSTMYAAW